MRDALRLLYRAHRYASSLDVDVWQFAVSLDALRSAGASETGLRWLLAAKRLTHGIETTRLSSRRRLFDRSAHLGFVGGSHFVLTKAGVLVAQRVSAHSHAVDQPASKLVLSEKELEKGTGKPFWDADSRELWLDGVLITRFDKPAPELEVLLTEFQRLKWPFRIADPLPPEPGVNPKQRLRDAIRRLNAHLSLPLISFSGDGTGRGVCWRRVA